MKSRFPISLAAGALLASAVPGPAHADSAIRVVASINPVHSLVSTVMAGIGVPYPAMRDAGSHHEFNMRPSDATAIQEADVIFLIDESIESALASAIDRLARNAEVIELSAAPGLVLWPFREGGAFEDDPHHVHEHEADDDHGMGADHDHGDGTDHGHEHGSGADHGHSHAHSDDHDDDHGDDDHDDDDHARSDDHDDDHGEGSPFDLHIWLDPVNAQAMVQVIADTLARVDPANADLYDHNAHELIHRLEDLVEEINKDVAPARGKPFIVFHDGYRYFEERFGLVAAGSAVVSAQQSPGVRRIRELREKVKELGVVCVLDEPQFDRRMVNTIVEGTQIRSGTVDPMGLNMEGGPEMYFALLRDVATSFTDCLAPSGGE